jgi:hypothetical protein
MSAVELDFGSEFLNHSTKSTGSGFLKAWKEDGSIVVWVHPTAPIFSLWSHRFYKTVEVEEDGEKIVKVFSFRDNCLEKEALLKKQRYRDRDTDEREMPPAICPHCLMVEWVRTQINSGKLEWSDPVFDFKSDDQESDVTLYAGGICGLFQKPKLTKEELGHLRKSGIKQKEAYKQNGFARQQYVMSVCSEADADAGWLIALEGPTLGDKMRKAINDEIKRCGGDVHQGHPKYNPYPFEWTYDENKEFDDKYDVVALTRTKPKGVIAELLADAENNVPDTGRITSEPYLGTLRQLMRDHAVIDMPIDSWFEDAISKYGERFESSSDDAEEKPESVPEVKTKSAKKQEEEQAEEAESEAEPEAESSSDDEMFECDTCDNLLRADELKCTKCQTQYGTDKEGNSIIVSRKCANKDCMENEVPVVLGGDSPCPQCGGVHDSDWNISYPKRVAKKGKATRKK